MHRSSRRPIVKRSGTVWSSRSSAEWYHLSAQQDGVLVGGCCLRLVCNVRLLALYIHGSSGPSLVRVCASQQYRHYSGNRHYSLRTLTSTLVNPICTQRFHRPLLYDTRLLDAIIAKRSHPRPSSYFVYPVCTFVSLRVAAPENNSVHSTVSSLCKRRPLIGGSCLVGCSLALIRLAEHLKALRAWCSVCLVDENATCSVPAL